VKKVGDKKQLNFEGLTLKGEQPQPVGAGVGDAGDAGSSAAEEE
jgi:hypothetical protein